MTTRRIAIAAFLLLFVGISLGVIYPFVLRENPGTSDPAKSRGSLFEVGLRDTQGVDVKLGDYKGDVLVVNFWATWCFPCRLEIPDLIELSRRYKSQGVRVLGIAVDESGLEAVKSFAREMGMIYPVLIGDQSVAEAFGGIVGFPSTFLLSRDGTIYSRYTGLAPKAQIDQDIRYLLSEHR